MTDKRIDFTDLLKWSLNYQEQYPKDPNATEEDPHVPRQLSETDQRFLLDAMDNKVMDEQKRVKVLLQVMRLPADPNILYLMENLNTTTTLKPLQDKESLRTLLEMRQEDEQRKKLGLDIIGMEYIPGNVLSIDEIIKKELLLSTLSQLPVLEDDVKSALGDKYDTVSSDERMEKRAEVKKERLEKTMEQVSAQLPTHIKSILDKIPPPTDIQLREVYNRIREQKLETLEEIEDRTHRGDNAIGFVTFNGLPILKQYLLSHDYEIAADAWRLLGGIVSNQPLCQQKAIEYGLVPMAIEALNLTRYIPSILASHAYSQHELVNEFTPPPSPSMGDYGDSVGLSLSPKLKATNITLSESEFNTLMKQYAPATLGKEEYGQWLYQHSHFGQNYVNFLLPMLKSVLYFLVSVCNNNSTAQTQFVLHHGMIPVSHLIQMGWYHIGKVMDGDDDDDDGCGGQLSPSQLQSQSSQSSTKSAQGKKTSPGGVAGGTVGVNPIEFGVKDLERMCGVGQNGQNMDENDQNGCGLGATAQLLYKLITKQDSTFKQIMRRVFQLAILLVDDEYKVTTSGEIVNLIFENTKAYAQILSSSSSSTTTTSSTTSTPIIPGTGILTFVPKQPLGIKSDVGMAQQQQQNGQNDRMGDDETKSTEAATTTTKSTVEDLFLTTTSTSTNTSNLDEGHARVYFQDPVAPLRLENHEDIHPAFKLKSNLAGGKLNSDGVHTETQFYLAPFTSLLLPIFFPFTLWKNYFNCNDWDRDVVVGSQRLMSMVLKNYYPLTAFSPTLSPSSFPHITSQSTLTAIKTTKNPTPDQISQWIGAEFEGKRKKLGPSGKFATLLHNFYTAQAQSLYSATHSITTESSSTPQPKPKQLTKAQSIQYVIAVLDQHIKSLVARANLGNAEQKSQHREWNAQESKFIGIMKAGLNQ